MFHYCQICGRRLSPKDLATNPFNCKLLCRYCGAEYKISKNFFHYFLVLLTWIATLFILLSLYVLDFDRSINIITGIVVICSSIMFSIMIGRTEKIDRLNRVTRKSGTMTHV